MAKLRLGFNVLNMALLLKALVGQSIIIFFPAKDLAFERCTLIRKLDISNEVRTSLQASQFEIATLLMWIGDYRSILSVILKMDNGCYANTLQFHLRVLNAHTKINDILNGHEGHPTPQQDPYPLNFEWELFLARKTEKEPQSLIWSDWLLMVFETEYSKFNFFMIRS